MSSQSAPPSAEGNFYYLGDVFDDRTETLYIDPVHVTPEGNALIASRIVAVCCGYTATRPLR